MRREAPARSRSRSRGRGDRDGGRDWGSTGLSQAVRHRSADQSVGHSRGGAQYDDYAPRGDVRGESRGDHRGGGDTRGTGDQRIDSRVDHRGDSRSDPRGDIRGGGDYPPRRAAAPAAAYRGDSGYERGSADAYEGRGGGAYDRR